VGSLVPVIELVDDEPVTEDASFDESLVLVGRDVDVLVLSFNEVRELDKSGFSEDESRLVGVALLLAIDEEDAG
jgi:hypothetical protein